MSKIIIAIDGPAGSGKSSTAKLVAKMLDYIYIDTGAMYRAVTLYCLINKIELTESAIISEKDNIKLSFRINKGESNKIFLDDTEVTKEIRSSEVTQNVSVVSSFAKVRSWMVEMQREMGRDGGVVIDGRDIGTVVFPKAQLKIFLVASIDARASRRYKQNVSLGINEDLDSIKQEIIQRDNFDSTRKESPLRRAKDAVLIDSSNMNLNDQVRIIYNLANSIINKY
jgi:CMP/dCMP kinase